MPVIRLDDCYHTDPALAPALPRYDGPGRVVNFSDPAAIDPGRLRRYPAEHSDGALVIVEGIFALTLPQLRAAARWKVYIDTPPDISIARKTLRRIAEGRDPALTLRGYLEHGRAAYLTHIAPGRHVADLVVDGTAAVAEAASVIVRHVRPAAAG
ncbi:uridine kinase family protein [Dactylosporangium sp. CA-152071]|uniref:uridine kinase family protein n=1 Tax=Dactylosporangium sp. CA-152071 TaxID=3239933 RepID=UPI003D8C41A6